MRRALMVSGIAASLVCGCGASSDSRQPELGDAPEPLFAATSELVSPYARDYPTAVVRVGGERRYWLVTLPTETSDVVYGAVDLRTSSVAARWAPAGQVTGVCPLGRAWERAAIVVVGPESAGSELWGFDARTASFTLLARIAGDAYPNLAPGQTQCRSFEGGEVLVGLVRRESGPPVADNADVAMIVDEAWVAATEQGEPCQTASCLPLVTEELPDGRRGSSAFANLDSYAEEEVYRVRPVFTGHGGPSTYRLEAASRVGREIREVHEVATFPGGTPDLISMEWSPGGTILVVHGNRGESPVPFSFLVLGETGEMLATGRLVGSDAMLPLGRGRTMLLWPGQRPVVVEATVRGREVSWAYRAADGAVAAVYDRDHALVLSYNEDRTEVTLRSYE